MYRRARIQVSPTATIWIYVEDEKDDEDEEALFVRRRILNLK